MSAAAAANDRPTRVIIDTDPGLDDTAAILFTLACPELVTVELFTTVFGNTAIEHVTRNLLSILTVAGRTDIPVYQGADRPLLREPRYAPHIHSEDGLGGLSGQFPPSGQVQQGIAAEKIVQHIMASPGDMTLIALGPLTNVALALRLEPRLATSVKQIVLMGGAVRVPGNVSAVASANMLNDPDAAALVYNSGAPLVQAGLDVARPTIISPAHLARIAAANTPAARMLSAVAKANIASYMRSFGDEGGARFNDLPTVGYVVAPELYHVERYPVVIETTGTYTTGMTVVDWRGQLGLPANTDVLLGIDSAGLVELFTERLSSGYRP
ncbi:MAG: nucleoside hydrolase [Chloroflexi bacterium]|nr:nucleoside hydrolase [Chloroflexota bacterium]